MICMRWLLSITIMMLLMATSISGCSQADNDALTVIVLIKDGNYHVGDIVEYFVHVFHKGTLADADSEPLIQIGWYGIGAVQRIGTGVYCGNATIDRSTAASGFFQIVATATLGKSGPDDRSYDEAFGLAEVLVPANSSTGFEVYASLKSTSEPIIAPGTTLILGVLTTNAGSPVTPENLHVELDVDELGIDSQDLPTIMIGTGDYEIQYKVPLSNTSFGLAFLTRASYNGEKRYSVPYITVDFFGVYARLAEKNDTGAVMEFLISSTDGKAVQGAYLDMTYFFDNKRSVPENHLYVGPTDANGSLRVGMDIPSGAESVHFYGWANTTALSQQNIGGYIQLVQAKSASSPGKGIFGVVDLTEAPRPGAGHVWPMKFRIFNDTVTWANREVECFVVTGRVGYMAHFQATKLEASLLQTNAAGEIRLPVTIPNWTNYHIEIIFKSVTGLHPMTNGTDAHESTDGLLYSNYWYYVYQPQTLIPARPGPRLALGQPLNITVDAGGSSWPVAAVEWLPGEQCSTYLDKYYDLQPLNQLYTYLSLRDGRYKGSIAIPVNMPGDRNYTSFVYLDEGILPLRLSNSSEQVTPPVIPPKKPSVSLTSGESCITLATILGLLAAALFIVIYYRHRPSGPEE